MWKKCARGIAILFHKSASQSPVYPVNHRIISHLSIDSFGGHQPSQNMGLGSRYISFCILQVAIFERHSTEQIMWPVIYVTKIDVVVITTMWFSW